MKAIMIPTMLLAASLFIGPAVAQQQLTGTGQFCRKAATGPIQCEYPTMAHCEQARPHGSSEQCVPRSQAQGTVGGPAAPAAREQPSAPGEQKD